MRRDNDISFNERTTIDQDASESIQRLQTAVQVYLGDRNQENYNQITKEFHLLAFYRRYDVILDQLKFLKNELSQEDFEQLINCRSKSGYGLLHNAIHDNKIREIEELLKLGANPNLLVNAPSNSTYHKCTPLHMIMDRKGPIDRTPIIRILLQHGADPNAENAEGHTPTSPQFLNESATLRDSQWSAIAEYKKAQAELAQSTNNRATPVTSNRATPVQSPETKQENIRVKSKPDASMYESKTPNVPKHRNLFKNIFKREPKWIAQSCIELKKDIEDYNRLLPDLNNPKHEISVIARHSAASILAKIESKQQNLNNYINSGQFVSKNSKHSIQHLGLQVDEIKQKNQKTEYAVIPKR